MASYALSASKGLVAAIPGGLRPVFDVLEFGMVALGLALLYRHVPNTRVEWGHAAVGAVFAALGVEVAKSLLAWYVAKVPTYSMVYGTFATVPILLVWLYVLWVLVLLGAVVTAYMPSLLAGVARRGGHAGLVVPAGAGGVGRPGRTARPCCRRCGPGSRHGPGRAGAGPAGGRPAA